MEESTQDILTVLLTNRSATLINMKKSIGTTVNKLKEMVTDINTRFDKELIIEKEDELLINENYIDYVYDLLTSNIHISLDQRVRMLMIKVSIALNENNASLIELADFIDVSKNTALKDINIIKREIESNKICLSYSRKKGYQLSGQEELIRKYLIECLYELISLPIGKRLLSDSKLIDKKECMFLLKRLENVEKRLNITFSDEMLEVLPYSTFVIIKRIRNGTEACTFSEDINKLVETKEYATISSVFWNYEFLKEDDLIYLTLLVLSSNLINSDNDFYHSAVFIKILNTFIRNLENKLAVCFSDVDKLTNSLSQHLRGTLFRLELGIEVFNPLAEQFIVDYTSVFQLVKQELKIFKTITSKPVPDGEIAFISMIILSNLMENSKKVKEKPFKAVVVCKSGTSISRLLKNTLQDVFKFIEFSEVYSIRKFDQTHPKDIDFVFSTIPLKTEKPVLLVSSVLSEQEIGKLKKGILKNIESNTVYKAKYIISYLGDFLKHEKQTEAFEEIQNALNFEFTLENNLKRNDDLLKSEGQISIIDQKLPWQDLMDISFEPMWKRDSISNRYITRTKKVFYDNYETMLIGPGVLLPHITPEDDVKESDVQLLILNEPVTAPNGSQFDMVIALAPGHHNEHVDWIIKVNELLTETSFKEKVYSAASKQEMIDLFRKEGMLL